MPIAPTDRTGDTAVVTATTIPVASWRDAGVRAELRLADEEHLAARARVDRLKLREDRIESVTYLRRHRWTDEATGDPRHWDEQATPGQATHVLVRLEASAYRPG